MGKMVMGYWDCPVCGNQGIAGNVMNCPACGRARGDVKFYMKGVAEDEIRGNRRHRIPERGPEAAVREEPRLVLQLLQQPEQG